VSRLLDLERDFPTLEAGKEAGKHLAELRKLPQAKEAFEALEEPETPTEPSATVATQTDDPYDIDNNFFTDEELEALDEMASGEEPKPAKPKSTSVSQECRRLLSFARSWIANKQPDKARELLERIIEKHPRTIYADQAKVLLKKLD
jgi:hypothetical protein